MRSTVLGICVICGILWLFSSVVSAEPVVSASCGTPCLQTGAVLSVSIGQEVTFQVADSAKPILEAIWVFGDGTKAYGLTGSHVYTIPGKYTLEALVVYKDELPVSVTLTVHVVSAPALAAASKTLFGLPTEIVYPVLAALATVIVYWLTGATP